MLEQIKSLKYYILYAVSLLGIYTWTDLKGYSFYGDDSVKHTQQDRTHTGGHGIYYHK